jgi:hypothetical protein
MPVFDAWALPPAGITDPGYRATVDPFNDLTVRFKKISKKVLTRFRVLAKNDAPLPELRGKINKVGKTKTR